MADTYCENLVREADKDRFLATLFAPAQHRAALFTLHAFDAEVSRIGRLVRDPLAGEIRLQWWHDALSERGRENAMGHPVAAALKDITERYALPVPALTDLISAHRFDVYREPMQTIAELEQYAAQTSGIMLDLTAQILNGGTPAKTAALSRAGSIATVVARLLTSLPWRSADGMHYFPLELLNAHGVRPEAVLAGEDSDPLRRALLELRGLARRRLSEAAGQLLDTPERLHAAFLPLAIVPVLLALIEGKRDRTFAPVELSQWKRQRILWRAARDLPRAIKRQSGRADSAVQPRCV